MGKAGKTLMEMPVSPGQVNGASTPVIRVELDKTLGDLNGYTLVGNSPDEVVVAVWKTSIRPWTVYATWRTP